MTELILIWFALGFIAYIWIGFHVYHKDGYVEFGLDELLELIGYVVLGALALFTVSYIVLNLDRKWITIKKKGK